MLSPLSDMGVEKQLLRLPGVHRVDVDYVTTSATVTYDETVVDLKTIKEKIRDCGFHCSGTIQPKHVCVPEDPPAAAVAAAPVARAHEGHAVPALAAPSARDEMAHEMGHGPGMDMQAMARDMRNRFWIAFAFTVPIFLSAPMGLLLPALPPPFWLDLNLWLFLLASGAAARKAP
jgi:Cu2+-exporting ATPase